MSASGRPSLVVNGVLVDLDDGLLRGRSGEAVSLRPQSFAVLHLLAENRDRVVTKGEIMTAVWSGVAVTDDSLVQCISEIRRVLGDEKHSIVRTMPRRGYRLVLPDVAPAAATRRRPRWALAAGAAATFALAAAGVWWLGRPTLPAGVPLVAVLPFDALTTDERTRLLARGLTDDVITDLARIPEFEVLASAATASYRGMDADPRAVGSALNADFVIDGSITHDADRVRVTAKLYDAGSGVTLWSERWDRPATDVFAVQSEIAETIANRLGGGAGLVQETGRQAVRRKPPSNLNAYELCLLGSDQVDRLARPELDAARDLLTRAVELDPGLARAWIELHYTHVLLASLGVEPERNRALAAAAAERALALDPGDPEAHVVYGSMLTVRNDFSRARAEYETALRLAPNAAEILIHYIDWSSSSGKPELGADLVERAIRLDPNYPIWANRVFAYANFMAGRYEQAVAFYERLGTEHHNRRSWSAHAGAVAALGRRDQAAALVKQALAAHPALSIEVVINLPSTSEFEKARSIETLRLAGFRQCATPKALADIAAPQRLPECTRAETGSP